MSGWRWGCFPNKRRDLGGIIFLVSFFGRDGPGWIVVVVRYPASRFGFVNVIIGISMFQTRDLPFTPTTLFEVAARVWCRVAAGVEVVVEVFFEAGELRRISWMNWLDSGGNNIVVLFGICEFGNASAVVVLSGQRDNGARTESAGETRGYSSSSEASLTPSGRFITVLVILPER